MSHADTWYMLNRAAHVARRGSDRQYLIGAITRRRDGALITASNGRSILPTRDSHAEIRLIRKLDRAPVVYIARVMKGTGELGLAHPCWRCIVAMKSRGVKECFFTIAPTKYGRLTLVR